ncbi:MAG: hypothetical protein GX092_04405 [Clostridia bacterium]|jgi:hypothetical protein|nr:hypothetical protein [Clostridia bacterium]
MNKTNKKSTGFVLNNDVEVVINSTFGKIRINRKRYNELVEGLKYGENLGRTILERYATELLRQQLERQAPSGLDEITAKALAGKTVANNDKGIRSGRKARTSVEPIVRY